MEGEHDLKLKDELKNCKGVLALCVRKNGRVIERWQDHNLIVDAGRIRMAELLGGTKAGQHVTHIGIGSGSVQADPGDINLTNRTLVPVKAVSIDGKTAHFDFFIGTDAGNGTAIREFGLFCADGTMFSRRVRSGTIEKEPDIEIEGYWEIHF